MGSEHTALEPIAVIGGTGHLGKGLALRLAAAGYPVVIGSRSRERADYAADEVNRRVGSGRASGMDNAGAAESSSTVFFAVPYEGHVELLEDLRDALRGRVLVDTTVPIRWDDGPEHVPHVDGSAAEAAQALLGPAVGVVSGFHSVPAGRLADLDLPFGLDVDLCGNDEPALRAVAAIVSRIGGRPILCGPLAASSTLERMAVLLLALNRHYRRRGLTFRVDGL